MIDGLRRRVRSTSKRWRARSFEWSLLLVGAALSACADSDGNTDAGTMQADAAPDVDAALPPACLDSGTAAPHDVFCIGLYAEGDSHKYAASAVPYAPGVVLWSDGAQKKRYLALPPGTQIDTSDMDVWRFPVGTKAFKEFRFDGKLVETRMVWKRGEHDAVYATYIWDADEKAATLNEATTPTILPSGYEIPDGKDCGRCHHGGADKFLGLEAVALALPDATGITLESLTADGLLSNPPDLTSITLPEDGTGKAAFALGYLHANCGMPCHSDRGLGDETQLLLRLRAGEFWPEAGEDAGYSGADLTVADTDIYKHAFLQKPTTASVAQKFPDALRIIPGAHEQSLLWVLSHRRGEYQMPPLVSHAIDEEGTAKLAEWIDSLPH